uniref:TIR domain-containing protein n=1 Tax=Megaselia scalaris TaxID=36166 RepID=T1GWN3_MEGSC
MNCQILNLYCSNQGLSRIPQFPESITNRKTLDLRYNNLTELNESFLMQLQNERIPVYLSGNNWLSNCEDFSFIEFVTENQDLILDKEDIVTNFNGKPINLMTPMEDIQDICNLDFLPVVIGALTFLLLITFFTILFLIYNLEIKVWLFAHNLMLCWVSEEEIDKDREYDAFICFSEKDEKYVEEIVKHLESGPNSYKLCLHFRDWIVGDFITNQIVNSVKNSKRSIFILTKNFMESVWSKLEFRTAHIASMKEKRPRVIMILCENLEDIGELTEEIDSYITTNTYLKWNDYMFWDRLKYALPHIKIK